VGLLNQMTSVVDSIRTILNVLPPTMHDFFRSEVNDAISSSGADSGRGWHSGSEAAVAAELQLGATGGSLGARAV